MRSALGAFREQECGICLIEKECWTSSHLERPAVEGRKRIAEVMQRSELFLGLGDHYLLRIAKLPSCRLEYYNAGDAICRQGEYAKNLFVVNTGEILLTMDIPQGSGEGPTGAVVDKVLSGGIFGWSALVYPYILTLSCISVDQSSVLAVNGAELRQFMSEHPVVCREIMQGLLRVVALRLRDAYHLIVHQQVASAQSS